MRLTSLLFTLIASTSGLQIAAVRARVAERQAADAAAATHISRLAQLTAQLKEYETHAKVPRATPGALTSYCDQMANQNRARHARHTQHFQRASLLHTQSLTAVPVPTYTLS